MRFPYLSVCLACALVPAACKGSTRPPDEAPPADESADEPATEPAAPASATLVAFLRNEPERADIRAAGFFADGKRFYTGNQQIAIWDSETGHRVVRMEGHGKLVNKHDPDCGGCESYVEYAINRIAHSPDGARIVTVATDGRPRVWDTATGETLFVLGKEPAAAYCVAWSPDGARIATGGQDRVQLWDAAQGKRLAALEHDGSVYSIDFSRDGSLLLAVGDDSARLWQVATAKELAKITTPPVAAAALSPDGARLAVIAKDDTPTQILSAADGALVATLGATGFEAVFSPDSARVLTFVGRPAQVWDAATGTLLGTLTDPEGGAIRPERYGWAAYSPDGKHIATSRTPGFPSEPAGAVLIWNTATFALEATATVHAEIVYFSPDSARLLAVSVFNELASLWKLPDPSL